MKGFKFKEEGLYSGVLGRMSSLDTLYQLKDFLRQEKSPSSVWESLLESARVVIGYDDVRKVLTLHGPSFGPAWEVSYDDFEKMWRATDGYYLLAYPPDYAETLLKRPASLPYRARTPDEQAAEQYIYGYALSSVGRVKEAAERFNDGLTIPGIGKGYQHLLLFELAINSYNRGNTEEALSMAQRAIDLLPEHHRPYLFIAEIYRRSMIGDWQKKASDAEQKAQALCSDDEAQKTVARTLGRDFFIFGCKGILYYAGDL
jgi:tetratricopeptide (TPR) repeat protein